VERQREKSLYPIDFAGAPYGMKLVAPVSLLSCCFGKRAANDPEWNPRAAASAPLALIIILQRNR
jgi:hypothetical protein